MMVRARAALSMVARVDWPSAETEMRGMTNEVVLWMWMRRRHRIEVRPGEHFAIPKSRQ